MARAEDRTGAEQSATPATDSQGHRRNAVAFNIEVDGELFAVRRSADGGCHHDWLSGPNKNYGFSCNGPPNRSMEAPREAIRGFLSKVDPTTGYIEHW